VSDSSIPHGSSRSTRGPRLFPAPLLALPRHLAADALRLTLRPEQDNRMEVTSQFDLAQIDALIFDLGGVIVNLAPDATIQAFSELFSMDARSIYTQTGQERLFDEFERGEIGEAEFRNGVAHLARLNTAISPSVFDAAWNAMLGELPLEHLALLDGLRKEKRIFLLSNTNSIHIECFLKTYEREHVATFGPWEGLFEDVHYSHELKMRKPESRIFSTVLARHRLTAERTLFIDDNRQNVEAASALGFATIHHSTNQPLTDRFRL
jgi:FMN phosphatase YigB (HAD superfamily)